MKRQHYSLSSAPTSIQSKSNSYILSGLNSPTVFSPSMLTLKDSLSKKQLHLTESLLNYSRTLSSKIPELAKRWSNEDKRLTQIQAKKYDAALKFKQNSINKPTLDILEQRVLSTEAILAQSQASLNDLKHQVNTMKTRKKDYEQAKNSLTRISTKSIKLQERLNKLIRYKEISLKNLNDLAESQRTLKEIEEIYLTKSENIIDSQESIASSISSVVRARENLRQESESFVLDKEKSRLRTVFNDLYRKNEEMRENNEVRKGQMKGLVEKVEAKLALIRLEANHVAEKRKKIAQLSEFLSLKLDQLKKYCQRKCS